MFTYCIGYFTKDDKEFIQSFQSQEDFEIVEMVCKSLGYKVEYWRSI
jgi:hypothetical protein